LDYLDKLFKKEDEEVKENKDIQLICSTISGRTIVANYLKNYPDEYSSSKNAESNSKENKDKTYILSENNIKILTNIISASLMSIHQNMENLNFENTKSLTLSMFKFYW